MSACGGTADMHGSRKEVGTHFGKIAQQAVPFLEGSIHGSICAASMSSQQMTQWYLRSQATTAGMQQSAA